jgi:hypothetical protein
LAGERKNIRIILGDFQKAEKELAKADIVYLYLLNSALVQIEDWFFKTISKDARVVSLCFWFENHNNQKIINTFNLGRETQVRLYKK